MTIGKHKTKKTANSPIYSAQWSGVSYAPHCSKGCTCPKCGERLHVEAGEHYCPVCDDYVKPKGVAYHEAHG